MDRYGRQVMFLGKDRQKKIKGTTACIIGVGALGTVAADILARAGMDLILIDEDIVQLDNLQRQSLFSEEDIGKKKSFTAKLKLQEANSQISILAHDARISEDTLSLIPSSAIVLVCTDNMESKLLISDHCHSRTVCITGSAAGSKGIVYTYTTGKPCFRCLFDGKTGDTAATIGVLGSLTHMIGSMMANEAIKSASGKPEESLLQIDVMTNELLKIKVKRSCKRCSL
jgi:molybdopterin-synthase adenylyltransferase